MPVQFSRQCFACPSSKENGGRCCQDMIRVCLMCARRYLELNVPRMQRDVSRKCLMCDTRAELSTLNDEVAYHKDFLLMSLDTRADYPCFWSEDGCGFLGNQTQLERHIREDCDFRSIRCPGRSRMGACRKNCVAHKLAEHILMNCEFHADCPICKDRISINSLETHLEVAHDAIECVHCKMTILPKSDLNHHMEKMCPNKPLDCSICGDHGISRVVFGEHIHHHIVGCSQVMTQCTAQIRQVAQTIDDAIKLIRQLSSPSNSVNALDNHNNWHD